MKIVLIGYGKMGQMIAKLAKDKGYSIAGIIDHKEGLLSNGEKINLLQHADVAIEFTRPDAVMANIELCLEAGIPMVVGTTGWMDYLPQVQQMVAQKNGTLLYASNFSVGVNLFIKMLDVCNNFMLQYPEYKVSMKEWHHAKKLDAPSGTALSLAGIIQQKRKFKEGIKLEEKEHPSTDYLSIEAIRQGEITGIHQIRFSGAVDEITLRHNAFNRSGFASGALFAAEWIREKKGIFNFTEVFQ